MVYVVLHFVAVNKGEVQRITRVIEVSNANWPWLLILASKLKEGVRNLITWECPYFKMAP